MASLCLTTHVYCHVMTFNFRVFPTAEWTRCTVVVKVVEYRVCLSAQSSDNHLCLSVCLYVCSVEGVAGAMFTGSLTTNAVDGILSTCNSTISAFIHLTIQLMIK